MAQSASSKRWLSRQNADPYVKQAQKLGYRSRALFKLEEIDQKYGLLKQARMVVDLGAAPGSWSQYVVNRTQAQVVACDLLPVDAMAKVEFIQGDFTEQQTVDAILAKIAPQKADVILSDMAPNMSGNKAIDIPKSAYLAELTLALCAPLLRPNGHCVIKSFHGTDFEVLIKSMRANFKQVKTFKPEASRKKSKEVYLVGLQFVAD